MTSIEVVASDFEHGRMHKSPAIPQALVVMIVSVIVIPPPVVVFLVVVLVVLKPLSEANDVAVSVVLLHLLIESVPKRLSTYEAILVVIHE